MTHSKKLPPQVLYPLLQQQVAELCSQDAFDILHFLDLVGRDRPRGPVLSLPRQPVVF